MIQKTPVKETIPSLQVQVQKHRSLPENVTKRKIICVNVNLVISPWLKK